MLLYVVISLILGSRVSAVPAITDPCGGSNPVPGTTGSQTGQVGMEAVRAIAIEARVYAKILVDKLTNTEDPRVYEGHSVKNAFNPFPIRCSYSYCNRRKPVIRISTSTVKQLANSRLEQYPRDRREYENTVIEKHLKMQNDYDNISVIAIFADQVHKDEVKANYFHSFKKEMFDFKIAINHLLCKLNMAAKTEGFEITKNITESVMLSKYRNMAIAVFRNMRDYMVFRDARVFVNAMSEDYF